MHNRRRFVSALLVSPVAVLAAPTAVASNVVGGWDDATVDAVIASLNNALSAPEIHAQLVLGSLRPAASANARNGGPGPDSPPDPGEAQTV